MKREDLDKAINAIDKEQRDLENKISALKATLWTLTRMAISRIGAVPMWLNLLRGRRSEL